MVEKTKNGRPPLLGDRKAARPSEVRGRLEPMAGPANIRRILDHALYMAGDRRFGSEVGRLLLYRQFTSAHAAIAWEIAAIYGAYERYEGLTRSARSPAYDSGFGSPPVETAEHIERRLEAKRKFDFLQTCLPVYPPEARTTIESLCVEDLHINPMLLDDVRALLERVAADFENWHEEQARAHRKQARVLTRAEKLERGAYAHRQNGVSVKPSALTGEAAEAAARDRDATVAKMEALNAARAVTA